MRIARIRRSANDPQRLAGLQMDFYLQHLRTGETLTLEPHCTLIGSADHATIRTADDSPYLAALLVRYPDGWKLHGLSDDPSVKYNRRPLRIAEPMIPRKSDVLTVGEDRYGFVTPRTEASADPSPSDP